LSYTRADDEKFFKGGISWLREELEQLVSGYIGEPFQIFQDTEDIQPSDRWEHKLDQALRAAQLFIPILTPRFFQSDFCRREAKAFLDYEERAGRAGLILPLYFIRTPKFDNPAIRDADDLAKALYARQYADWRALVVQLQHRDTRSQLAGKIDELAKTIAKNIERDLWATDVVDIPPPVPDQGAGPHFRINDDGLIDRAPDDNSDAIENEARMTSLQAGLRAGCSLLLGAGISQNAFGYLINDIEAYQDAISPPIREIQFTDVWRLGLVLQDHADAVSRDVDRLGPSLEDDQQAALKSLIGLHGPFILSSEEGRALQALSQENLSTREELRSFQVVADQFVEAIKDSTDLVTEQARDLIEHANKGVAGGRYPERHAATAQTTNQNFLSVLGFAATAAASAVIGQAVTTSGAGGELAQICAQTINAASKFFVSHEMVLKGLAAASGEGLAWLPHMVTWIKVQRSKKLAAGVPPPSIPQQGEDPLSRPSGTIFRDIDALWCPEMVVIPSGSFLMGSPVDEEGRREDEEPLHIVAIERPIALGRYPVTFDEFDYFCDQVGRERPHDEGWGRGRRPVINVEWVLAGQYCAWLSEQTGFDYLLPSEAWWEYACRAGNEARFTFGDDISIDQANFERHVGKTTEVGAYPANKFGLHDMHGNVWEWCEDRYQESYRRTPGDGSPSQVGLAGRRVLRGGSWAASMLRLRSASRDVLSQDTVGRYNGFRCARVSGQVLTA
jgi:hypothetical protein